MVSTPGILSFAGGLPAAELFPTAEYSKALQSVLASDARSLQYCPPFAPLTEHIRTIMQRRGVSCDTGQIVITSGAQQGIQILAQLLLAENPSVLLEETTYSGLDSAIAAFRPRIHTVSTSLDEGIDPSEVAAQLDTGIDPAFYAQRERSRTELLPWAHLGSGPPTDYLERQYEDIFTQLGSPLPEALAV